MEIRDPAALKRARKTMRYSQRDLGHLVRRTQTTIYKIETGRLRNITDDLAYALAHRLNCDLEDLFVIESPANEQRLLFDASAASQSNLCRPVVERVTGIEPA